MTQSSGERIMVEDPIGTPATRGSGVAPEPSWREMLCWHEGAHAVVARALGCELGGVTVESANDYGGLCWSSSSKGSEEDASRSDVERICSRVREMMPPPGASREWAAIWFLHARDEVVIKLAGLVGERLRYGREFTRDAPGACDAVEARAFAETLVVAPEAVEGLLRYCQTEAEAVVRKHWSSVEAVAAALKQCGTLSTAEIEGCIAVGVAADALAQEKRRREEWTRLIERSLPSPAIPAALLPPPASDAGR
jgi:hypothetical protein